MEFYSGQLCNYTFVITVKSHGSIIFITYYLDSLFIQQRLNFQTLHLLIHSQTLVPVANTAAKYTACTCITIN